MSKEQQRRIRAAHKDRVAVIGKAAVAIIGAMVLAGWAVALMP